MKKVNEMNNFAPIKKVTENHEPVAIVGIGASAGGIEAFSALLKNLPDNTGMAYIFVQHLQPQHESKLTEIFSKYTSMTVVQIKDKMPVKQNQVYIIPPDKYLIIKDKRLLLSQRKKTDGVYLPVDYFFQSLAKEGKNKTIGIILSGTASDGTLGLKAIKAEGGLTFAQDEQSAKYNGMPSSAIDSGNVDIILPPEDLAKELIRIGKHPYIAFSFPQKDKEIEPDEEDSFPKIFAKLRTATGVDFSHYKITTVKRRITRRMVVNKIEKIEDYAKLIREDKNEVNELYHDLLINVTNFFRDPEVFTTLRKKVYPEITKKISVSDPVRIWIPGCSTGEEVYSIAISLLEYLEMKSLNFNIQIFATDISEPAIEKARVGYYPASATKDLPQELLRKYFIKVNGGHQVNKIIRDLCIFARQDISKDPPFSRIDLISCRNLLIYLSPELQKKIIPVFHYALKPNRFLLLGVSESIGTFADLFFLIDNKFKIYEKKQAANHFDYSFNYNTSVLEKNKFQPNLDIPNDLIIQREADKIVLNRFSPPGVLVNKNLDIIQIRGKINQYIEPSQGDASLNLFKMMKEGLNLELHTSIKKAKKTQNPVTIEDISLDSNGNNKKIDLEVIPIKQSNNHQDIFYLVLFKEKYKVLPEKNNSSKSKGNKTVKERDDKSNENNKDNKIERLREELSISKEHLQSIVEEREAANEELRSALEELQSSNEELQSTNEEMETTREELQSTNEELITVNDELESRNVELNGTNNDLNNLLSSVNIPIIMLGRDLRIRRFTPKAEKIWNLISGDIGRPVGNISPNIQVDNLKEKIIDVIDRLEPKELEVKDNDGNWFSMKIRPYRTLDNKIDGVVISLIDVGTMKKSYEDALQGKKFAEAVFNTVREPLIILQSDLTVREANKSFYLKFELMKDEVIGKSIFNIGKGEWQNPDFKKFIEQIKKDNFSKDFELFIKDSSLKNLILNAQTFSDTLDDYILIAIREKENIKI